MPPDIALGNYKGMLEGIEIMTRNFEDTKLIAYLATNNAVKNELSLKVLAQSFAGNYAQSEITDITKIPLYQLIDYNLTDCLSTWFVYNKYLPRMIQDNQEDIYSSMFKPSVKLLLQVELVGMPISPKMVQQARETLTKTVQEHMDYLLSCPIIKDFHYTQLEEKVVADNKKLKTKVRTIEEFAHIQFNPGSDQQLQGLIYDYLGYEVIDVTDSKTPATGMKTLAKLINHAKTDEHKLIFENLIGLSKANKILTSFIPAFEKAQQLPDGSWRLYGGFNLGGTQSGRLSSSDPNMQNLPSGSEYGEIVKQCFISPPGWIFSGADFAALEAIGEALLSRDPNKLRIYAEGYDSHCLNTFAYFSNEMPDIINTVDSINSIKKKYKHLRSKSKAPTFALQYQGTWRTIMKSAGLSEELAKQVERNYHEFYKISDAWIKNVLDGAHIDGYVTGAFGLKIRTPILAQTRISNKMPYGATAERRSAGNAVTQSYGLLNNRAAIAFRERVDASPYKYDIFIVSLIHDASYALIRDNPIIIQWVNDNLIDCMQWQELDELKHDVVKLGANLDLLWPDWSKPLTLDNGATIDEIKLKAQEHKIKLVKQAMSV
jgi:DNA polymerase I